MTGLPPAAASWRAFGLFVLTALAEIVGCYLVYLWLRHRHSVCCWFPRA